MHISCSAWSGEGISHVRATPQHTVSGLIVHWYAGEHKHNVFTVIINTYTVSVLIYTMWLSTLLEGNSSNCCWFIQVQGSYVAAIEIPLCPKEVKQKAIEMWVRTHPLIVAKKLFSVNTLHYVYTKYIYTC